MSTERTYWRAGIDGWVVESRDSRHTVNGTEHVSWWYGPAHGWGTTWGTLDSSTQVWSRYDDALAAATASLHYVGKRRRREVLVRAVEHAERDELARLDAYLARTPDAYDSTHARAEALRQSLATR